MKKHLDDRMLGGDDVLTLFLCNKKT